MRRVKENHLEIVLVAGTKMRRDLAVAVTAEVTDSTGGWCVLPTSTASHQPRLETY